MFILSSYEAGILYTNSCRITAYATLPGYFLLNFCFNALIQMNGRRSGDLTTGPQLLAKVASCKVYKPPFSIGKYMPPQTLQRKMKCRTLKIPH
jgi:hypothetical protein